MDFKERFKDKTSRITKDGPFANENVVKGFSTHTSLKSTSTNGITAKFQTQPPPKQPLEKTSRKNLFLNFFFKKYIRNTKGTHLFFVYFFFFSLEQIIEPSQKVVVEYTKELKENKLNPFYIHHPYEEAINQDYSNRRDNSYLTPQSNVTNKVDT